MGYCKNILMVLPLCFLVPEPQVVGKRQPPPGGTTMSVDVNLVLLRVIVRDRKGGFVSSLNKNTGGEACVPNVKREVVTICRRIAEDIRNQYTIGYAPSNQKFDDTYRTVRVTATGQRPEQYVVRTRAGYIASFGRKGVPEHSRKSSR